MIVASRSRNRPHAFEYCHVTCNVVASCGNGGAVVLVKQYPEACDSVNVGRPWGVHWNPYPMHSFDERNEHSCARAPIVSLLASCLCGKEKEENV